jgi:ligand-binding sensor domain-containing protein
MGKLNKQTGLCDYQYKLVDKNNNYIQRVYDFAEDKNKRLWIATMLFGLFYYDLKTKEFTSIQSRTSLINEWIGCLHYSDDNKLYVGTYDGVNCIDLDSPDFQSHKILSQNVIYSIFEDADGVVWLGSSEGLSGWNKKTKETNHLYDCRRIAPLIQYMPYKETEKISLDKHQCGISNSKRKRQIYQLLCQRRITGK